MKPLFILLIITLGICGCISCKKNTERFSREKEIDQFSDKLVAIIRQKNAAGYLELLPRNDDKIVNILSGEESVAPINKDILSKKHSETVSNFTTAIQKIENKLGRVADITSFEGKYVIDDIPLNKKIGLFKFDLELCLSRGTNIIHIKQRECVLCTRGVLCASDIEVTQ